MHVRFPHLDEPVTLLALQIHHMISDGWSLRILTAELERLVLDLKVSDKTPHLNFIQHSILEQRQTSCADDFDVKMTYWERHLKNAEVVPFLQPDWFFSSSRRASSIYKYLTTSVDDIRSFCKEKSIPEFVLMYAGFLSAFYALSGSDDITTLLTMSNREPKTKDITGVFINILPLRLEIEYGMTLQLLVHNITRSLDEMRQNSLSYQIIEKMLLKSGKMFQDDTCSIVPLQILFVYDYDETTPFRESGLFNNVAVHCNFMSFSCLEVYVTMDDSTKTFSVHVAFPQDMYRTRTVERLLDTWNKCLHTIVHGENLLTPMDMLIKRCLPEYSPPSTSIESDLTFGVTPNMCQIVTKEDDEIAITIPPFDTITWNQFKRIHSTFVSLFRNDSSPVLVLYKVGFSAHFLAIMASSKVLGILPVQKNTLDELSVLLNAHSEQEFILISHTDYIEELQQYESSSDIKVLSVECLDTSQVETGASSMSKLKADVRNCLQVIADHVIPQDSNGVSCATIFASSDSPTMVIALSLVIRGVSVKVLTQDMIDSTIEHVSGSDVLVLPESMLPRIFPITNKLVGIQKIWIHGFPLALAHMSTYKALCHKILITHSLLPNNCHISHVMKLSGEVFTSITHESSYHPIGRVCKNLKWNLLYKDGRLAQNGYMGEFVAVIDGQECHSCVLLRENEETNLHELIALDSRAYYNGRDLTNALTFLGKMPHVTWCHSESDGDKIPKLYYIVNADSSENPEQVYDKIKRELLLKWPLIPCSSVNPVQTSCVPITKNFSIDLNDLHAKLVDGEVPVPKVVPPDIEAVKERLFSVLSKAFEITHSEAKNCSNLVSLGSLSLARILSLTIELNKEFGTKLSIESVSQNAITTSFLADLVVSNI